MGVFLLGDLDKGLYLQPGCVAHGGNLHRHRGKIQQRHLDDARDHRRGQAGHNGHGSAYLDHDERTLKAGGDLAAIHPHLRQLLQRRSLTGGQKAVERTGGHHALPLQVCQMQRPPVGKGRVWVHQHMVPQREQGRKGDIPVAGVLGGVEEADIQLPGAQLFQRAAVVLRHNVYAGVGKLVLELGQNAGKGAVIEQLPQPDGQVGAVGVLNILRLLQRLPAKAGHLHHVQIKGLPGSGQLGAAGGALEQVQPGLLFQRVDLVGDGGLGGEQPLGGGAEIQLFCYGNKALQLVNRHRTTPLLV